MVQRQALGRVIGRRELDFVRDSGEIETAIVSIGEPVLPEIGGPWRCPYQIHTPSFERNFDIAGEDSMQALILTTHMISSELIALGRKYNGTFTQYGGDDLGFPDMQSLAAK